MAASAERNAAGAGVPGSGLAGLLAFVAVLFPLAAGCSAPAAGSRTAGDRTGKGASSGAGGRSGAGGAAYGGGGPTGTSGSPGLSGSALCSSEFPVIEAAPGLGVSLNGWASWSSSQLAIDTDGNVVIAAGFTARIDFGEGSLTATSPGLFVAKFDGNCRHLWSKVFTGVGARVNAGGIGTDSGSNIVIGGSVGGSVSFEGKEVTSAPFGSALFLAKLEPSGAILWVESFAPPSALPSYAYDLAVDGSDDIVMAGFATGDVDFGAGPLQPGSANQVAFLARFDPDGRPSWARTLPSRDGYDAMTATGDGGIALVGWNTGTLDYGEGPVLSQDTSYSYVSQLDATGTHLWSRKIEDTSVEAFWGTGVVSDASGNVIAASDRGSDAAARDGDSTLAKFSSDGEHLWSARSARHHDHWTGSLGVDRFDDVLEFGTFQGELLDGPHALHSDDAGDLYLVKRSPAGRVVWSKLIPGTLSDVPYGVGADAEGNVVAAGVHFENGVSVFVSKFAP